MGVDGRAVGPGEEFVGEGLRGEVRVTRGVGDDHLHKLEDAEYRGRTGQDWRMVFNHDDGFSHNDIEGVSRAFGGGTIVRDFRLEVIGARARRGPAHDAVGVNGRARGLGEECVGEGLRGEIMVGGSVGDDQFHQLGDGEDDCGR